MQGLEKLKALCVKGAARVSDAALLRLYCIDEVARFLVYGCDDREDFMQKYADIRASLLEPRTDAEEGASRILDSSFAAEQASALAYFCKAICTYSEERGYRVRPDVFFGNAISDVADTKVAYVRNAISDDAYRMLEKALAGATVTYTSSFSAACEEVYYGRVRYCILPYETSDEGTLSGFMKMIRKYELYPKLTCSVRSERAVTKFVLLGRNAYERTSLNNARKYLKITVDSPDFYTFARLSAASSSLGLRLVKSESIPVSWDDGRYGSALTFDITDTDAALEPFLLYLLLEAPECSDKAIYDEI